MTKAREHVLMELRLDHECENVCMENTNVNKAGTMRTNEREKERREEQSAD